MRLAVALASQGTRDTRWGKPEEIANLIVFAVSNAASYINGAAFVADDAMDKSQGMNRKEPNRLSEEIMGASFLR